MHSLMPSIQTSTHSHKRTQITWALLSPYVSSSFSLKIDERECDGISPKMIFLIRKQERQRARNLMCIYFAKQTQRHRRY